MYLERYESETNRNGAELMPLTRTRPKKTMSYQAIDIESEEEKQEE